jgi:acetone carboxylase alpha subunit
MSKPGEYLRETEGLNFKSLVQRNDSRLKKDGYYVKELTLKEEDPIKYEVLYAKLTQMLDGAKETCKAISGSYSVRELGENLAVLYTAEGDAVVSSSGVFLHLHTMGRQVKYIMENDYETNPGVCRGDYFFNNDPHIGGQHTPDQNVVTPIFYRGRLIAWSGSMTHISETGAVSPGGLTPDAPNRFWEGLFVPAMKIADHDWLRADWEQMFGRNTRDATVWILDVKGKFGTCMITRDQLEGLVDEYGVDYFSEALREYIEDSRRTAKEKVRQLVIPGKYRARNFVDVDCRDRLLLLEQINVEFTIGRDGSLTMDMEGSSPEGEHPFQGSLACGEGSALCMFLQYLFHDCRFNDGTLYAIDLRIPKGSIFWVNEKAATGRYIASPGAAQMATICDFGARAYYMAARFEDVLAPCPSTGPLPLIGGKDQYGTLMGGALADHGASGLSALAVRDGLHACYAMWQPEGDTGNAESWEKTLPVIYLGRRIRMDGGGLGKYRGGSPLHSIWFIHPKSDPEVGSLAQGKFFTSFHGLMGGYPGDRSVIRTARNTNLKELIEKGRPLPKGLGLEKGIRGELKGDIDIDARQNWRPLPAPPYTVFEVLQMGGSGFGDPLERDPELILKDLINGVVSREASEQICGVVMDGDWANPRSLKCNREETNKVRARMREERKKRGIPARDYIKMNREKILKGDIPKYPKEMINKVLAFSPRWASWFRDEWGLPENFKEVP